MEKKINLVSVIIPCYNGGAVVHRLLDSLLEQTYKNLEIIFVNDGSIDNTEDVVKEYISSFEKQGILFKYIYQDNRGLGGAINTGLEKISGEFFIWPDADDMLTPDSVEKKMRVLLENQDIPLVTSNAYITSSDEPYKPVCFLVKKNRNMYSENLFEDYLFGRGVIVFCSGCHMMRTEMFELANNGRKIYPARRGQNWQLLLPVLYRYKKRIWLDEALYYYIVSHNSMSKDFNVDDFLYRNDEHKDILIHTVSTIILDKKECSIYLKQISDCYIVKKTVILACNKRIMELVYNIFNNRKLLSIYKHIYLLLFNKISY